MDVSGYWSTLVSIILGLAVADLLVNLHRLIDHRKHVEWDRLPLIWTLIVLLWLFNYWWAVATNLDGSRDATVVGHFVLLALPPIMLFLMAASVLPHASLTEAKFSMRADWADRRNVFFTFFAINQFVTWIIATMHHSLSWDTASSMRTAAFLLILSTLYFKSRRLEWIVAIALLALVVVRLSTQPVR
jgi:hypothetical protein